MNHKKQEQQESTKLVDKFDTFSLAGSDSGVSVKSGNSTKVQKMQKKNNQKNNQTNNKNMPKIKTVQKFTVFKNQTTPDSSSSEFSVRQPTFSTGFRSNFQNQGKLRASTDDKSVIGIDSSSSSTVYAAKPVSEPRTWSNSRLHKRQARGRIGSRS